MPACGGQGGQWDRLVDVDNRFLSVMPPWKIMGGIGAEGPWARVPVAMGGCC